MFAAANSAVACVVHCLFEGPKKGSSEGTELCRTVVADGRAMVQTPGVQQDEGDGQRKCQHKVENEKGIASCAPPHTCCYPIITLDVRIVCG